MTVFAETIMEKPMDAEEELPFAEQLEKLYSSIEQLEDAVAQAKRREQLWLREKKQYMELKGKLEKKLSGADDDIRFIKEHLDQAKKEREQAQQQARQEKDRLASQFRSEREEMQAQIKQLREKNEQLKHNMDRVTAKLDAAITKIGELMD